jgi:hypothetical protein
VSVLKNLTSTFAWVLEEKIKTKNVADWQNKPTNQPPPNATFTNKKNKQ